MNFTKKFNLKFSWYFLNAENSFYSNVQDLCVVNTSYNYVVQETATQSYRTKYFKISWMCLDPPQPTAFSTGPGDHFKIRATQRIRILLEETKGR